MLKSGGFAKVTTCFFDEKNMGKRISTVSIWKAVKFSAKKSQNRTASIATLVSAYESGRRLGWWLVIKT
jgi:hypothetical protein